jgi:type 1 glutamine amidotransferase
MRRLLAPLASAALVLTALVVPAGGAAARAKAADPVLQEVTLAKGPAATGELSRVETAPGGNRAPTAVLDADKTSGAGPLMVAFDATGSTDPESDPLTYAWTFGDGGTSTGASPTHTYQANGSYAAKVTVTDTAGNAGNATVTITVGNTAPAVTVSAPAEGAVFGFGDAIPYTVTVSDPEDSTVDCAKVTVSFVLGHDEHGHPITSATGCTGVLHTTANSEHNPSDNLFGVIDASYTDAGGLTGHSQVVIQPRHRQAEHFATSSGNVAVIPSPRAEGSFVGAIHNGDWIGFSPYDLDRVTGISAVVASGEDGGQIQVRTGAPDGPVAGTLAVPGTGGWETFTTVTAALAAPAGTGSLFLTFTGAEGRDLFNVDSFTVLGGGGNGDLARGRPVTASSTYEAHRVPELVTDGDSTTRWSSEYSDPQWITVDLGAVYELRRVRLSWETAYARAYQLQTSADGQEWTTVHSTTAGDGGIDEIRFEGSGRYVRVYGTQRATGWGYSLFDVNVYGESQGEPPGYRVLLFSKTTGFRHDSIPAGVAAIERLGAEHGFAVDATEDAAAFTPENLARYKAVVFLSTTGDVLDANQQAAFEAYIRGGGGFAGIHAAADTEYDWPWYGGLVGAYFQSHPATQEATVRFEDRANPSTAHFPPTWTRTDEWYDYRTNPRANVKVLANLDESSYSGGSMGADHPITWCQRYDGGRSWYTGMGHTAESYADENYLKMLLGGIRLAAGDAAGDCRPESGYTPLFDGTQASLDQWRHAGPGGFTLENGTISSVGGMGLLWFPVRTFSDYSLKVDWMMPGDDNGGVFIGFPNPGDDPWAPVSAGHEIQIDATDNDPTRTTGSVYSFKAPDTALRAANLNEPGEWNSYDIRVSGQHVEVYLNGVKITDYTSDRAIADGYIGVQNDGAGLDISYRDIRVRAGGTTGDDLARGRPTEASTVEAGSTHASGNAVDGNASTRWGSEHSDPQWISVDLGAVYDLSRVRLNWEAAFARSYEIQASTNGTDWAPVYSTTAGNGGIDDVEVAGEARYVRIYCVERGTQWGYSLWDLNVYGAPTGGADTTAPSTDVSVAGPRSGGWYTGAATVTLTASDEPGGSGLESTSYQVDGATQWTVYSGPFAVTGDGEHEVRFRSTDKAGNVEQVRTATLRTDATAPLTTATFAPAGDEGWHAGAVPVTLAATDGGAGVATTQWSLDGGPWTVYTGPVDITGDGEHELRYRATDAAGNAEALKSAIVKVDGTGPTTIVSGVADGGLYGDSQDVRITYQAVDLASGIATTAGTMDGAAYPSGRLQPLYDLGLGMHELTVTATDKAGNRTTTTVRFHVTTSFRDLGNLIDRFRATGQLSKPAHQKLSNKLDAARASAATGNDKRALQQLAALRELAVDTTLVPDPDVRAVLTRDIDALTAIID